MNRLQIKYILLNLIFWMMCCAMYGYATIFLQDRGLASGQIGLVKGGACVLMIILSPYLSTAILKIPGLGLRKMMGGMMLLILGMCGVLCLRNLPLLLLMALSTLINFLILAMMPLMSNMGMAYMQAGEKVNYGVARGMGSFSYAVSAALFGYFTESAGGDVVLYACLGAGILGLLLLVNMPELPVERKEQSESMKGKYFKTMGKYKSFLGILTGFALAFAATTALETYLIHIVNHLGGGDFFFGIGIFSAAASEGVMMALTPLLLRRYKSIQLLGVSAAAFIVRNFLICLAPNLGILMAGELLQGVSYGLLIAVIAYYVAETLQSEEQILGHTSVTIFVNGIGATFGNVAGGMLQEHFGLNAMYGAVCIWSAAGGLLVLALVRRIQQARKRARNV